MGLWLDRGRECDNLHQAIEIQIIHYLCGTDSPVSVALNTPLDRPIDRALRGFFIRFCYPSVTRPPKWRLLVTNKPIYHSELQPILERSNRFGKGNNDATLERLFPFIVGCFDYIKNNLPEEWSKGDADDGFLTINANVESLLRLFSDIVDHIVKAKGVNPKVDSTQNVMQEMEFYLDPIIDFYKNLTSESKIELKKSYGIAGRTKVWRILQREISKVRTDFHPDGLDKYWKDEDKRYNEDSFRFIRDIETFMKEDFKTKLEQAYGSQWFKRGVPKAVYDKANQLASEKNYEITDASEEYSPWDCLTLIDYRRIATYGSNWRDIFEKYYTKPGEEKGGNKEAKTEWMQKLERIRNNNFHTYSVKEEEFEFLSELHKWLIETSD